MGPTAPQWWSVGRASGDQLSVFPVKLCSSLQGILGSAKVVYSHRNGLAAPFWHGESSASSTTLPSGLASMWLCRCWSWGVVGELKSWTRLWEMGCTSVARFGVVGDQKGADETLFLHLSCRAVRPVLQMLGHPTGGDHHLHQHHSHCGCFLSSLPIPSFAPFYPNCPTCMDLAKYRSVTLC